MINRRILMVHSACVTSTFLLLKNTARAQGINSAVKNLMANIPSVFATNARFSPDPNFIDRFLSEELSGRQSFFKEIASISAENLSKNFDPAFSSFEIRNNDDVELVKIRPEEVSAIKLLREIQAQPDDTASEIILDILVETIGLEIFRDAFVELATSDTKFGRQFRDLSENIGLRDFAAAIENISAILIWLVSMAGLAALQRTLKTMTSAQIKRRILISLGARLVPYIGWSFTAACLSVCIYAHRKRLAKIF